MRRICLSLACSLILSAALVVPASSTATSTAAGEAHPLIKRALNALQSAKTDLKNAAHDYCGHRVEALEATNSAIGELQQALDCADRKDRSTATFDAETESSGSSSERHPNINRAISALGEVEGDLQNAARDYCGHRVKALESTRVALNQLRLAVECDK
jgi:exonuclease VII large subunit